VSPNGAIRQGLGTVDTAGHDSTRGVEGGMGPQYTEALETEVNRLTNVVKTMEGAIGAISQALAQAENERDEAELVCHLVARYDNFQVEWKQVREAYYRWRNL